MGKSGERDKNIPFGEENHVFDSPSKDVEFYKQRIDELEDEIKMLKKLIKKREKYEELLREKNKLMNSHVRSRKR